MSLLRKVSQFTLGILLISTLIHLIIFASVILIEVIHAEVLLPYLFAGILVIGVIFTIIQAIIGITDKIQKYQNTNG